MLAAALAGSSFPVEAAVSVRAGAAPAKLPAAFAPLIPAPGLSARTVAPAAVPGGPGRIERPVAESAAFFDLASLAPAPEEPIGPAAPQAPDDAPPSWVGVDGARASGLERSAPRLPRHMNHHLLGARPRGVRAWGRAALFLARGTGLLSLWQLYREGILLQRHAQRLRDAGQPPAARAASARLLAEIGAVEAAPVLGWAYEHDPSPRVRGAAAAGLLLMAEHAAPRLTRAMSRRLTPAGREGAATALGWLVAHADVPDALQALGNAAVLDRSDAVRLAAIRSLGRAASPRAVKLLYWVRTHAGRPGLRFAAEEALREHAARQARLGVTRYQPSTDDFGQTSSPLQASALRRSVAVGLIFAALEFTGGVLTNNAALKADALHLAGDRMLDATGLFALFLARRPPNARRTYGYIKAEAVFALLGALVIAGVAAGMLPDAWHGVSGVWSWLFAGGAALPVAGWSVAAYASLGLLANVFSGLLLMRHKNDSMTARAAYLHVLADALGSAGIIVSTALGAALGWTFLQPFVLAAIVVLILRTAWELGRPAWNVLMDAVPPGLSLDQLELDFLSVPGVVGVHDLHVRMLNGSSFELAAKATIGRDADHDTVLAALQTLLRERYKITHATIQLELTMGSDPIVN